MKRYTFFFFALFILPSVLFAASMSVDESVVLPTTGERSVSVFLDTGGSTINAIEGDILVFGDVAITDIRDGASFISLWTEKLFFEGNSAHFSGIIPGGFTGEGEILSLVLHGTAEGTATISFSNVAVFLDDGLGTEEKIEPERVTLEVSADAQGDVASDILPPEAFSIGMINVSEDPTRPLYALIFATDDKQTGIDRYEVQEVASGGEIVDSGWKEASSPYILLDQSQKSEYYVRAYDNAGNTQEVVFNPEGSRAMIVVMLLVAVLLAIVLFVIHRYARRPKRTR